MAPMREDLAPNIRGFPFENLVIYYRIVDDTIVIVRVLSRYQNTDDQF